jgi:hypothetical protein
MANHMIDIPENELSSKTQKWIALIAGVLGFIAGSFYYDTLTTSEFWLDPLWFLHDGDELKFSLPGLIHGLIALAMLIPLYVRRIIAYRNMSTISLLLLIVNIYLFSAWIQFATGFQGDFSNLVVNISLLAAILLGWLGMRSIAGFCWIIVVALCGYNMINGSEMLAAWGILFLVSSVVSIWFQTKMPLEDFFSAMKSEFSSATQGNLAHSVRENIQIAASSAAENLHAATLKLDEGKSSASAQQRLTS